MDWEGFDIRVVGIDREGRDDQILIMGWYYIHLNAAIL